jgi:hypothetical protein
VTRGSPYKFALLKGKKSAHLGKVIIKFSWRIQYWSNLWGWKEDTSGYLRPKFRLRRDEIAELQQKKGQLAEQSPNQGFKRCIFFFWKFAYLLTRRSNWGDSKSGIKWDKRSIT